MIDSKLLDSLEYYSANRHYCLLAVCLRDSDVMSQVISFTNDSIDDIHPTPEEINAIGKIISYTKTIYDIGRYRLAMTDLEWDRMITEFKKYAPEPYASSSIGLADKAYKYDKLAGTLDKTHYVYTSERSDNRPSVEEWVDKLEPYFRNGLTMMINYKQDGLCLIGDLEQRNDRYNIVGSMSRGNLDYGEGGDISIVTDGIVFKNTKFNNIGLGVQYEFTMTNDQRKMFEQFLNKVEPFANNRNASAGLLRRMLFSTKDDIKKLRKFYSLVPVGFDVNRYVNDSYVDTYEEVLRNFTHGGIDMRYWTKEFYDKNEFLKWFREKAYYVNELRDSLQYAIDGLVITVCNLDVQEELGRNGHINKYQIAYKFPESRVKTKIIDYVVTTGNFGYKELTVITEPVYLNGTKQNKGGTHSINKFKKFDLHIGDECYLKLAGDVIPHLEVDDNCVRGNGKKIKLPKICDACSSVLEVAKDRLRCVNPSCELNIIGKLITFVKVMNGKGIAEETIAKLYHDLGISTIQEFLSLQYEDFLQLDGFKESSSQACVNCLDRIKHGKKKPAVILSSLGIDNLRTSTAEKIFDRIPYGDLICLIRDGDFEKLSNELASCNGIDSNANSFAEDLIALGADYIDDIFGMLCIDWNPNDCYDGVIVITGFRDEYFENIANMNHYKVKTSGKKYDLLVIKDTSYMTKPKAVYAHANNIPIITREEFLSRYDA